MRDRFEIFSITVTRAYKYIQQIKKHESVTFGIKGIHVMCLFFLGKHPQGLTVTELSTLCYEDKAATSRSLDSLAEKGYITYEKSDAKRRWRSKVTLTDEGSRVAGEVQGVIHDIVEKIGEGISEEQAVEFYRMFSTINRRLEKYCEELERHREAESQQGSV